jgi:hypothetical protein
MPAPVLRLALKGMREPQYPEFVVMATDDLEPHG